MSQAGHSLLVIKSPEERFSLKNVAVVNNGMRPSSVPEGKCIYGSVENVGKDVYLTLEFSSKIPSGKIALSSLQREWLGVDLGDPLSVGLYNIANQISTISLELDFFSKPKKATPAIDTDQLATSFSQTFSDNVFCAGQQVLMGFEKFPMLKATVLKVSAVDPRTLTGSSKKVSNKFGKLFNSTITFEKKSDSSLQLIGRHKGDSAHTAIISPDWDFNQMGIGGLHKEFSDIFRRAFASRVFPPDVVEQLGMKHVRGILLFGPPGTGKTLMARQIGKMLHAREPKIVNGPEILNKFVGESEANIRNLFAEADTDQKKMGINSALHIIIFDEIDAICRTRGSLSGSSGVHDTVVNQLLSKIDGVEQLNNILLIGMTNRKDMIDEALLRPGRLEVQMEIGLPDENGRLEILNIHTAQMVKHGKLTADVDVKLLAERTRNFSGAELEGLVRSAQATAMNKLIKAKDKNLVTREEADKLQVTMADFQHALDYDVKPAFGISEDELDNYAFNGIIQWSSQVQDILDTGELAFKQAIESQRTPLVSLLLRGNPGSGKTALAATIAKQSGFPFVKVISPENMVGFSEGAKCQAIKKVFDDAYKSELSCVVVDDIERLLDYVAIGPRFSNLVVQALLVLLRKKPPTITGKPPHKLLIIGTTGFNDDVLQMLGITDAFDRCIEIPYINSGNHLLEILKESGVTGFTDEQIKLLEKRLKSQSCFVGIRKLLSLIEAARLRPDCVPNLIARLEQEAGLTK